MVLAIVMMFTFSGCVSYEASDTARTTKTVDSTETTDASDTSDSTITTKTTEAWNQVHTDCDLDFK